MKCNCKNNFCEKRQKELSSRYFQYCQGTSGLSEEKEQWYLDNKYGTPQPPNIFVQAKNFAVAVTEHAASGFKNVNDEEYERRIDICRSCPFAIKTKDNVQCSRCGCQMTGNVIAKARWASQKCPENKW